MISRSSPPLAVALALFFCFFAACSSESAAPIEGAPSEPAATIDAAPAEEAHAEADAAAPVFEKGEKIDAPAGKWTWVDFPDSSCANGSPTGIGVNLGTSKRLVIYLEGGGACWNALTCYTVYTAINITTGFGKKEFEAWKPPAGSLFDRTNAESSLKDASFVYVPYCTGDVHSGDKVGTYNGKLTRHVGRKNFAAFLKRIVPTFEGADRVILSGSSAGGFGAALNFSRVQHAFGEAMRVDVIDDSGPPLPQSKLKFFDEWDAAWDVKGGLPPDCAACATDLSAAMPYYMTAYAKSRFALLSYTEDQTIRQFSGLTAPEFKIALNELNASTFDPSANGRVFILEGDKHTMLGKLSVEGKRFVSLASWIATMQDDNATWTSVTPDR